MKHAGQDTKTKQNALLETLKKDSLDAVILHDATSICWLLNVRAFDVPFAPCITAYLIAYSSGKIKLFTSSLAGPSVESYLKNNNVTLAGLDSFEKSLMELKNKKVLLSELAPFFLAERLKNYVLGKDPCLLPKAIKNKIELQGALKAGAKDSKALMNFFNWLDKALKGKKLTELDIVDKLIQFRKEQKNFISPSFPNIVGFNDNAAIIHYQPKESSNKKITGNGILLIDSGGHYLEGTTDITRTIAIGKPTAEQIHNFTLVLKGHISLITSIFPEGACGAHLDTLAHIALWKEGKDYDHGTGHGVGSVLEVHEGPQSISRNGTYPLMEGMIVSVEPGFYKPKHYGIRIENLAYIKKSKFPGYLTFEALTYVPIDAKLVDHKMLTRDETDWLLNYNRKCSEIHKA
jgi:Xaa-Pro aminopeptidase